ncbi:pyridoxal phosphate-dependent decarboxylase family protein [Ruania alba]|uniref:Pyridoxal-dependent decarboxylase conserved domain-containing protein n=1 Tax=Ruania alba TaxID=648782 RepID=A0A1H5LGE6_9MICO|nr:aminotransferase class V-fold PLP-dependent enzyme [Ruania alba]SEE76100.1 Pyridoxal-dependent decarboxylase conserved domain-containing protein [Ruania alba]
MQLPEHGMDPAEIRTGWAEATSDDVDWRGGRGWSLVYDSPAWHQELVDDAGALFAHENALSASAFPSVQQFESEVVDMVGSIVAPGRDFYGVFTSGGTESIMVALKGYRDLPANVNKRRLVMPVTAHPGFWKAADYLGFTVELVGVGADGLPDVAELLAAVDESTAAVCLSAPCFPFGVVDPIEEVGAALAGTGVGLHIDAAMGGLFLPFLDAAGTTPPRFGLDVPGVTSVSVDLHKYGYGAKGASVLLFATPELRHASYYVSTGWPGGAYAASGVIGTRAVGPAAAAWTAMSALGRSGYRELVAQVMTTARTIQAGLTENGLQVIGTPPMGVFAATSSGPSIASIASALGTRGWWIDTQDSPPSLHVVTFPRHADIVETFLTDVRDAVAEAAAGQAPEGSGASYGVMVRGGRIDDQVLREHLDERFTARR